jgi:hypothetical protein
MNLAASRGTPVKEVEQKKYSCDPNSQPMDRLRGVEGCDQSQKELAQLSVFPCNLILL